MKPRLAVWVVVVGAALALLEIPASGAAGPGRVDGRPSLSPGRYKFNRAQAAAAATTTGVPRSCRALLRPTVLPGFPIPPGCKPIDTSWIVGYEEPGLTAYLSGRGSPEGILGRLKDKVHGNDIKVRRTTPRGGRCQPQDVLDLGIRPVRCAALSLTASGGFDARVLAISCGNRSQIEITDVQQHAQAGDVIHPCLDPKGTGVAVPRAEAKRSLLDSLCNGKQPLKIYEQPHLLYAIDQLKIPGLTLDFSVGLHELPAPASCQQLQVEGVLALAPGQKSWRTPDDWADKARSGVGGASVVVYLRVRAGGTVGWAPLESDTAFLPTQPGRELLEPFPILSPEPTKPGQADLTLSAEPAKHEGEPCTPGSPSTPGSLPTNFWVVEVHNAGTGPTPPELDIEVTVSGQSPDTSRFHLTRGLEPGETFPLNGTVGDASTLTVGTRIRLDPGDKVAETNKANNDLVLGPLQVFTCVPA